MFKVSTPLPDGTEGFQIVLTDPEVALLEVALANAKDTGLLSQSGPTQPPVSFVSAAASGRNQYRSCAEVQAAMDAKREAQERKDNDG